MVLEIINSAMTHQLAQNPNLVYTLLYKRDVFQPYRTNSAFQDIIQNIYSVSQRNFLKIRRDYTRLVTVRFFCFR